MKQAINSNHYFNSKNFSKRLYFFGLFSLTILLLGCSNSIKSAISSNPIVLEDWMYLIERFGTKKSDILPLKEGEKIILFNPEFLEKTDQTSEFIVVNTKELVPLALAERPKTENQSDNRKKLLLKLSEEAKVQLKHFTKKHLNAHTAIVVNNEALTKHKIKAVIDGGYLQITRCTDNACELLYAELQDNIIKKE